MKGVAALVAAALLGGSFGLLVGVPAAQSVGVLLSLTMIVVVILTAHAKKL